MTVCLDLYRVVLQDTIPGRRPRLCMYPRTTTFPSEENMLSTNIGLAEFPLTIHSLLYWNRQFSDRPLDRSVHCREPACH